MSKVPWVTRIIAAVVLCGARAGVAEPVSPHDNGRLRAAGPPFVLGPPSDGGPVVVLARFDLHSINDIDDEAETFEFSGVLTLRWQDKRQAFDPALEGVNEKIFQGAFQFDEISPAWFPQVVLVNESGMLEKCGTVLRAQPDGTMTLIETYNAVVKTRLDMRRFPFDRQRLEAVFELPGFDHTEVVLRAEASTDALADVDLWIPEWSIKGIEQSTRNRIAPYAGQRGVASVFVISIDARRRPFFMIRLVMLPFAIIVLLGFSVFWMDRASLGDRLSISFIGILTAVAYQMATSDAMPHIAYVTVMNAFLTIGFLTMCASAVINLVVGALDRAGKSEVGDRLDRRCRRIFPIAWFGLNLLVGAALFLFY